MRRSPITFPIAMLLVGAGGLGYYGSGMIHAGPRLMRAGCDIKGNISIDTGERIYHLRGQEHYAETIIRPEYGERWFCSESEARAAGWRKSRT